MLYDNIRFVMYLFLFICRQQHGKTQLLNLSHSASANLLRAANLHDIVGQIRASVLTDIKSCTSKLNKWFNRKNPQRTQTLLWSLPGVALGSACGHLIWKNADVIFLRAQCKAKHGHRNRLSHHDDEDQQNNKESSPKFQWGLFFQLVWKDIFYLLGAIVVL